MMDRSLLTTAWSLLLAASVPAAAKGEQGQTPDQPPGAQQPAPANPYNLTPFHAAFPVELTYPNPRGLDYDRTRRQMLEQVAANLQGNCRREAWQMAMEFFWRAPEDAIEPLIAAMDSAFGNAALADTVKNVVEAMAKMGNERFEGALLRAVEHKNPVVRQAAFSALVTSGKPATLRLMYGWFTQMDARSRGAWLAAVRERLGADGVTILRELMMADHPVAVRDEVLKQALLLPAPQAAEVLRGRWTEALGEFKAIIAGVLHATGDTAATTWLQEAIQGEDLGRMGLAIRHSVFGELGDLRSVVLRASTHLRAEVRLEVAQALRRVEGDDVADVYEVLSRPDEVWEVKAIALRELTRRGRSGVVTALLEELQTATGTRLQLLLRQLAESGDPRAIPDLMARFERAAAEDRRPFLQAMAHNRSDAAAVALIGLFDGPEQVVSRGSSANHTTISYIPTLLLNTRGAESRILDHLARIAPDDWRRRAALLPTLTGIAADSRDPALQQRCLQPLRAILFDSKQIPQLRVLCLNLLTSRWITIDDALRLKNIREREQPTMRALFTDFLHDYF